MKLSTLCIVALACMAAAPAPRRATDTLPVEEIARRMIRKQYQGRDKLPERVTFASIQVNAQGTNNYTVQAKFTVRGYYSDQTTAYDYDQRFLLSKKSGTWEIQADIGTTSTVRYEAKSAPPPLGDVDVSGAVVSAQSDRSAPAAARGGANTVTLGKYNCVMYAGGQLINVGGFTLLAGGVYHDQDNGRGTFTYDLSQHQITFRGAAMAGQVGLYDAARSKFTLKSARNSIDCDRGN